MNNLYSTHFNVDNVIVTSSGMSALAVAVQCTVGHGDHVVIPSPVWPNLPSLPQILGADITRVSIKPIEGKWTLDLDELFAACHTRTKALMINSPNNPTGWMMSDEEQWKILEFCREQGIWLIADEVYSRIVYDREYAPTFADKVTEDDNYLIINSFSKAWAMTGWRLGWITAPRKLKTPLEMLVEYNFSCIFAPTQVAGIAALEHGEQFIDESRERYHAARHLLINEFQKIDQISFPYPEAAFYAFFSIKGVDDSYSLAEDIIEQTGVGLAPGVAFGPEGEGFLRICYAVDLDLLREAVKRLKTYLVT